jgi:hypothetical protein
MRPYTVTALTLAFLGCVFFLSVYDGDFVSFLAGAFVGGLVGIAFWVRDDPPSFVVNWGRGAAGERKTADTLAPLLGEGWQVRHDVDVGRGNADHLVLSPSGNAFLLETKAFAGRITLERGQLICRFSDDPVDMRRYAVKDQMAYLTATVSGEWARRTGRVAPEIQPVVVVWGDLTPPLIRDGDLVVLSGEGLEMFLRGREAANASLGRSPRVRVGGRDAKV